MFGVSLQKKTSRSRFIVCMERIVCGKEGGKVFFCGQERKGMERFFRSDHKIILIIITRSKMGNACLWGGNGRRSVVGFKPGGLCTLLSLPLPDKRKAKEE